MKTVAEARTEATKRFDREFLGWAQATAANAEPPRIPWALSLGAPDERQALAHYDATSQWARDWLDYAGPGTIRQVQRAWRSLASQRMPTHLEFTAPAEIAQFVRRSREWQNAQTRLRQLGTDWGTIGPLDRRTFTQLVALTEREWERTRAFLLWVDAHPTSQLLPRQLPIPGVDSKWFEAHRSVCVGLRRATAADETESDGFGLRVLEPPLTLRILDETLRETLGGLSDFSARPDTLAALDWHPSTVIVCENLQCAYSFGDIPGTVLIAKQGYAVDVLYRLPWLPAARILYWGDLDTHGFAILNRFRSHFPRAESILMDEATLLEHRELWSSETKQSLQSLSLLTEAEQQVMESLRMDRYGVGVRLEQERIPWELALATLLPLVRMGRIPPRALTR